MNTKLAANKTLVFSVICAVVLIIVFAIVVAGHNNVQIPTFASNNVLIGKWEKVALPDDKPYQIVVTPDGSGFPGDIVGKSVKNADQPYAITEVPSTCRSLYPQEMEFFGDGTFSASPNSVLRGGDFQITSDGGLRTRYINGSLLTYDLTLKNNQMTLELAGCRIVYQRAKN